MSPPASADIPVTPAVLRQWPLPAPSEGDDKGQRGTVLIVGGSARTPGAVILAGIAALRVGAGEVRIATTASTAAAVGAAVPEALVAPLPETATGDIDGSAGDEIAE